MDTSPDITGSAVDGNVERGFATPGIISDGYAVDTLLAIEHVSTGL